VTTFALVHGAWHGAWCWERLTPELERRNHAVVAPDLPCDDLDATFADYAGVVETALEDAGDDVVLVGHSLGGMTIALVAARRPVHALVYLCALVPIPGMSLVEQVRAERETFVPGYWAGIEATADRRASRWADFALARTTLYGDCTEADARWAFERLRPQSDAPDRVPCPLERLPDVAAVSIVCADDAIVAPAWSRHVARERLGVEPVELPGGHSPYLSRPAALAALLDAQA
jgi:pimeloyl-ACP methyl ester carboxylesterase